MKSNIKMLEQLTFSLISLERYSEAESIIKENFTNDYVNIGYFPLGLIFTAQNKIMEAIEVLKLELHENPKNEFVNELLFELLLNEAAIKANEKDWKTLSSLLSTAFDIASDTDKAQNELLKFKNIIPLAYIKEGERQKAFLLLRDELKKDGKNPWIIHSIALLNYWWALTEEQKYFSNGTNSTISHVKLDELWENTTAYWILLMNYNNYWDEWIKEKMELWGNEISESDIQNIKVKLVHEKLVQTFTDYIDKYKIQNKNEDVIRHEVYLTKLEFEKKSAKNFKNFLAKINNENGSLIFPKDINRNDFCEFNLPAGRTFFNSNNLLKDVQKVIKAFENSNKDERLFPLLNILFTDKNIGYFLILAEDRNQPEQALVEIDKILATIDKNESIDIISQTNYVKARILVKKAINASEIGEINEAVNLWADADELIRQSMQHSERESLLELFHKLQNEVHELTIHACEEFAKRKKQSNKPSEAINIIERVLKWADSSTLKEHLSILYCDLGYEKLDKKKYSAARELFGKALHISTANDNANRGMGTAYNNEAVALNNFNTKVKLFKKALKYDSRDDVVIENLTMAYNSQAVSILNSLNDYSSHSNCDPAINYLEEGLMLLNPSLELSKLYVLSTMEEWEFNNVVREWDDDFYRTMMRNYWIALRSKNNLRGY